MKTNSDIGTAPGSGKEKLPKVLVCQHGSRHRYAIPRMLEREGLLSRLYTDSSSGSRLGSFVRFFKTLSPGSAGHDRWNIQGVPARKIKSGDLPHVYELINKYAPNRDNGVHLFRRRHELLSSRMIRWGLGGADMIYSMYHENLDFIRHARQQGMVCAVDVFISPLTESIMEEELELFPMWGAPLDKATMDVHAGLWDETAELADVLICPSVWVAEGVAACSPAAADKIEIVPYGCSMNYRDKTNTPEPGRILFAGRDPLRKGVQYLAQAATLLKKEYGNKIDVRIAGSMPKAVVNDPLCKNLNFIGQLNRSQIEQEFLTAEMMVLPALSEGFAGVVAEAIGAGCPVVVTKEAGSPVVHEREGLVVPSKNPQALMEAVRRLLEDRDLRQHCSEECRKQIPFYSEEAWQQRLTSVLKKSARN